MAKGKEAVQEGPQPVDQGKEVRPLTKAKDTENALTIKDVLSKAKGAEYRPKADDPKKDPPMPRHSYWSSLLYFFVLFLFLFFFFFFSFLFFVFVVVVMAVHHYL